MRLSPSGHSLHPRWGAVWLLAVAQGAQAAGLQLLTVALALYGARESDPLGLGMTLAARTLPTLFLALVGGIFADRWNKGRISAVCLTGTAGSTALVAVALPLCGLGWQVQAVSLVSGLISAVGAPALYALLPSIVDDDENIKANGIVRASRNLASAVGPVLAVVLARHVGVVAPVWASAALGLVAAGLVSCLPVPDTGGGQSGPGSVLADLRGIGNVLARNRWLVWTVPFWSVFLAVQAGAADVVQPIWVIDRGGDVAWSFMSSSMTLGYVIGSLIAVRVRTRWLVSGSMTLGALGGMQLIASGLCGHTWQWCAASFITGMGLELSGVLWGSALQTRVSKDEIGRAASFDYAASFGLIPIGYAVFGLVSGGTEAGLLLAAVGLSLACAGACGGFAAQRVDRAAVPQDVNQAQSVPDSPDAAPAGDARNSADAQ